MARWGRGYGDIDSPLRLPLFLRTTLVILPRWVALAPSFPQLLATALRFGTAFVFFFSYAPVELPVSFPQNPIAISVSGALTITSKGSRRSRGRSPRTPAPRYKPNRRPLLRFSPNAGPGLFIGGSGFFFESLDDSGNTVYEFLVNSPLVVDRCLIYSWLLNQFFTNLSRFPTRFSFTVPKLFFCCTKNRRERGGCWSYWTREREPSSAGTTARVDSALSVRTMGAKLYSYTTRA